MTDAAFERDKVCYQENSQHHRALNQAMWQVPIIAMTLNGGLWYAATNGAAPMLFRVALFFGALAFDIALIGVLFRLRYVLLQYGEAMKRFNPKAYVDAPGAGPFYNRPQFVSLSFIFALCAAGIVSLIGMIVYSLRL